MTVRGTSSNLTFGPGKFFTAPIGTTEPVDLATAWVGAWVLLGYTKDGSTFTAGVSTSPVNVAEELEVIKNITTGRTGTVALAAQEMLAKNLQIAFNGGTVTTGTGIVTYDPPALGQEVRIMCGWEAEDASERLIFRQCLQSGSVAINRQPGANNAQLPLSFSLEKPNTVQSWRWIGASARA